MALSFPRLRGAWNALRARPADPSRGGRLQFIGRNNAGVHVNHDIAMQVSAVWACIDVISSALSSSDWNVYAGLRGENKTQATPGDRLQYVLNTRANKDMTAQAAKRALGIAAVGYGNGYAEIQRDLAGRVIGLWPIGPDRVEVRRDVETGHLVYRVSQGWSGGYVEMSPDDVFHIRGAGLTGVVGDDVVGRAIQAIAMAVALDQFGAAYFANGTQFGGLVEVPTKLDDAEFQRLKDQWNSKSSNKGPSQAFRVGILEGGAKYQQVQSDAEKSQLVAAKYLSVEEICRWFRVPPHKIAHLLRSTNNNIEHQGLEFSRDTLRSWKLEIEQEADYKLINQNGPAKFVEIDFDWTEQGDYKGRMEAYQIARGMGVFSANDILRKLGENTIGSDGDIRIVQGANIRLEDVGAAYATQEKPAEKQGGEEVVAEAWLQTIFQRVRRRYDNRLADLRRAGHVDADRRAADDAASVAASELKPLAKWLGEYRMERAVDSAASVINGLSPDEAAAAVFRE
jgi:HK97 family phage portal protein